MKNANTFASLATSFLDVDAKRSEVLHNALVLFGDNVTYDAQQAARKEIIVGYLVKKPGANEDAQNKFYSRFTMAVKAYAIENDYDLVFEKAKSTSDAATKKAAQRAVPDVVAACTTVAQLDAIAKPTGAIEAAQLEKHVATAKLALVKATEKLGEKASAEKMKVRRSAVVEWLKDTEHFLLVEAFMQGNIRPIVASVPLRTAQDAIDAVVKASVAAKAAKPASKAKLQALVKSKA